MIQYFSCCEIKVCTKMSVICWQSSIKKNKSNVEIGLLSNTPGTRGLVQAPRPNAGRAEKTRENQFFFRNKNKNYFIFLFRYSF